MNRIPNPDPCPRCDGTFLRHIQEHRADEITTWRCTDCGEVLFVGRGSRQVATQASAERGHT